MSVIKDVISGNGLCPMCDEDHASDAFAITEKFSMFGLDISVKSRVYKCPVTGVTYQTGEMLDETLAAIRGEIVKKTVSKIKTISSFYTAINLSSKEDRTIIINAFKEGTNSEISNVYRCDTENPKGINPKSLFACQIQDCSSPLLFIVDDFEQLKENEDWVLNHANENDLMIDRRCIVKEIK